MRDLEKRGIKIEMAPEDPQILKDYTVDFLSFSYYMSMAESGDPQAERTPGNTVLGVKNLNYHPLNGAGRLILKD